MAEEILKCIQQISLIIPIIILIIYVVNIQRDGKETYRRYKILFILAFGEMLVSITAVALGLILKDLTLIYSDMLFAVFYGWLCFEEYKELKELKNDMNQHDEKEDKKTISSIEEKN